MRASLLLFAIIATTAFGQTTDSVDQAIQDIFQTPSTSNSSNGFLEGFEEVTTKRDSSFGAISKCGEGEEKGVRMCVSYYNCDGKSKTIIQTEEYDGTGLLDIRFGSNQCDHPLEVCCGIPPGGVPPNITPPTTGGDISTPGGGRPPVTQRPVTQRPVTPPPIDPNRESFCGIRNENGIDFQITGNSNEAQFGEFPWMVAVLKKNYNPAVDPSLAICGGSIITPVVVLTGAHCVSKYKTNEIEVRGGEWDTQTERERLPYQQRDISQIVIHENFRANNLHNDVALLVLARPFDKYEHIGTICLPPQGQRFNSRDCFASGWGKDVFGKVGQFQVILKKIQLPIVANAQCQDALRRTRLGPKFKLHDTFICAGGEKGKDACTGDGGSPLICRDPSNPRRYVQAGIVAWGIGCGETNVPGVYADVSRFRNWIDQQMSRLNLATSPYTV